MQTQEKPICLVAHNGNRFDYPILRTEIHKTGESLPDDILCIDSLEAFKDLHNKQQEETHETIAEASRPKEVPPEFQDGYDELLCSIADEMENKTTEAKKENRSIEDIRRVNETTPQKRITVRKDLFSYKPADNSAEVSGNSEARASGVSKNVVRKLDFG